MQFSTFISFLLATSFVAGQETQDTLQEQTIPVTEEEMTMMAGYNASCRIEVQNPYDFFASVSFTYWQPIQENMELGVVNDSSNALDLVNGDEIDLDHKYKPGFKIAIGMNLDYDKWDTVIAYTWFRGTEKAKVSLNPNDPLIALLPAWQIPDFLNPQYDSGSEEWKLEMDLIDWDLRRKYHVGQELCFHYFIGLRCALIRQDLDVDYINRNPANFFIWPSTHIDKTSRSWGLGPRMGLFSDWNLGKGFRLYGNGEFDLLFTQYDLKSTQKSEVAVPNRYIVEKDNSNYLRAHTELCLGLGWGSYFQCERYYFDLSADYGFQAFFDQNMLRVPVDTQSVGRSVLPNGNLYMHGLTITVRFDF